MFKEIKKIKFPKPKDVKVNMMPFIMGDLNSIPEEYRQYDELIKECPIPESEFGKVGYLSINESFVPAGKTQRRRGLHTDATHLGRNGGRHGGGHGGRDKYGTGSAGIFLASNVSNTCCVWDTTILNPGYLGNCEKFRSKLGKPINLKANRLYWIADITPHEALPLNRDVYRQWFRIAGSDLGIWHAKHSTENRLGIQANAKISTESKFKTLKTG